ncbi:MAG: hypothetical protein H0V00_14685 [Chloroflexia bacterium]|nr:hypothetical protein [Chloroflexia bacterium]
MNRHRDSILWLADIRYRELQEDAARIRLIREAYGDAPLMRCALATACRHLEEMIGRARRYLEFVGWTPTVLRRGAVPRWPRLSTEREIGQAPTR